MTTTVVTKSYLKNKAAIIAALEDVELDTLK
jgi:hypothetical protein